jgi:hypothetical protein
MGIGIVKPLRLKERLYLLTAYTLAFAMIFSFSIKTGYSAIRGNLLTFLDGYILAILSMCFGLPFLTWLLVGAVLVVGIYGFPTIYWYLLTILPFLVLWKFLDSRLMKSQLLKYSIIVGIVVLLAKSALVYLEYESIQYDKDHPNEKMPD